jgi:hypothetical protein
LAQAESLRSLLMRGISGCGGRNPRPTRRRRGFGGQAVHSDRLAELLPGLFFAPGPRRGRSGRRADPIFMGTLYRIATQVSRGYFIFFAGGGGGIRGSPGEATFRSAGALQESNGLFCIHTREFSHEWGDNGNCCIGCVGYKCYMGLMSAEEVEALLERFDRRPTLGRHLGTWTGGGFRH